MRLTLFVVWLCVIAPSLPFRCTAPTTNRPEGGCLDRVNPGTPLSDLSLLKVYRVYFHSNDTTCVLTLPASGGEGKAFDFDVPVASGKMGLVYVTALDNTGNESCVGSQYVFVYPLQDSSSFVSGLSADYFDGLNYSAYSYTQIDSVVDFNWGEGSPVGLGSDTFSILFRGYIYIPQDDLYTFYLASDDGCRLWIDNAPVIDSWKDQWTEVPGQSILTKGMHQITLEYYENGGGALFQFRYSSESIPKQIVPASMLFH